MPTVRRLNKEGCIQKVIGVICIAAGIYFIFLGIFDVRLFKYLYDNKYIGIFSLTVVFSASSILLIYGFHKIIRYKIFKEVEISVDEFEEDGGQEEEPDDADEPKGGDAR